MPIPTALHRNCLSCAISCACSLSFVWRCVLCLLELPCISSGVSASDICVPPAIFSLNNYPIRFSLHFFFLLTQCESDLFHVENCYPCKSWVMVISFPLKITSCLPCETSAGRKLSRGLFRGILLGLPLALVPVLRCVPYILGCSSQGTLVNPCDACYVLWNASSCFTAASVPMIGEGRLFISISSASLLVLPTCVRAF